MDITSLYQVDSKYIEEAAKNSSITTKEMENDSFGSVFQAAMNMINQTNQLSNAADTEKMKWAMGLTENPHDLTIAMGKAEAALNYTIAVRDKFMEAYKEIMNMQL